MNYLTIPVVMIVVLTASSQLYDIAEQSSNKAVVFAEDIEGAMDCAVQGIELSKCSPNLMNTSFREDMENYSRVLNELNENQDMVFVTMPVGKNYIISTGDYNAFIKIESATDSRGYFKYVTPNPEFSITEFHLENNQSKELILTGNSVITARMTLVEINSEGALVLFEKVNNELEGFSITGFITRLFS